MLTIREVYDLNSAAARWPKTEYAIEATDEEQHVCWERTHETVRWQQCNGWIVTLAQLLVGEDRGHLERMPVTVCLTWHLLDGHLVAFYEASSQVVDHRIVEKYIRGNCSKHTNATNFHICMHDLGLQYPPRRQ